MDNRATVHKEGSITPGTSHLRLESDISIMDTSGQDELIQKSLLTRYRTVVIGVLVLLVCVGLGVFFFNSYSKFLTADKTVSRDGLRFSDIKLGRFERTISIQGNTIATQQNRVFNEIAGDVKLLVQSGDKVHEGDVLANIANPGLKNKLFQESSALDRAKIEIKRLKNRLTQEILKQQQLLDQLKIDLSLSKRKVEWLKNLVEQRLVSKKEYEDAQSSVQKFRIQVNAGLKQKTLLKEQLKLELAAKQLEITQMNAVVDELMRQQDSLTIRSPIDGTVGSINVESGDALTPSTALMSVIDTRTFAVEVNIPEAYVDDLSPGMNAEIKYQGHIIEGEIEALSPAVKKGFVAGKLKLKGAKPVYLRQNLAVNVTIFIESKENVLIVKRGPFLESYGGRKVYIVENEYAYLRNIEVGSIGLDKVEIVGGVSDGDTIIISNTSDFDGTTKVLIRD